MSYSSLNCVPFSLTLSLTLFGVQLDGNLEQWPHLNQLVQCYGTEWVKDVNKYGHYETTRPDTFQTQIFEGPDTDTETGKEKSYMHVLFCPLLSKSTLGAVFSLQSSGLLVLGVLHWMRMSPAFLGRLLLILDPPRFPFFFFFGSLCTALSFSWRDFVFFCLQHFGLPPLPAYEPAFDWDNERSMIFGQRTPESPAATYPRFFFFFLNL